MTRLFLLLTAAATAATVTFSAAEARDGCGRGLYYNGYRCVPERYYGERPYYGERYYGGRRYFDPGSYEAPNFRGNVVRPTIGNNGAISCSNANYTWVDGACRRRGSW